MCVYMYVGLGYNNGLGPWVYVHGASFFQPDEPGKGTARCGCSVCGGSFLPFILYPILLCVCWSRVQSVVVSNPT